MATNYTVDENDKRLAEVTKNKNEALTSHETAYTDAINGVDSKYNDLIAANKAYADKQAELQQQRTDFEIEKIEQQEKYAEKDYIKEQSGAYVDWQREKDSYGASAEQRAAAGLAGAGYSESAQVSLYNTYQNRVATARESFQRSKDNFANMIAEAKLQNSSILAEIALQTHIKEMELTLEGFQYKNQLVLEKANKKLEIENMYHIQYMQMYNQLFQEEQFKYSQEQARKEEEYRQAQLKLQSEQATTTTSESRAKNTANAKIVEKYGNKETSNNNKFESDAVKYIEALIASGATKDKVSNEIALALREKAITAQQATKLRQKFTPRGLEW